jgi:hypothetical protein
MPCLRSSRRKKLRRRQRDVTFLELCKFTAAQIGTNVDLPWVGPATVVNQTGQYGEIVNWVQMAYKAIQTEQPDWLWRWKKGTLLLTSGKNTYTLANITAQLTDFEEWKPLHFTNDVRYVLVYDTLTGVADETFCYYYPYQDYRGWRDRSTLPTGKPAYITEDPSGSGNVFEMSPIPNAGTGNSYTLVFDYRTAVDTLVGDAGTPLYLPVQFHEAICWKAVMYWAQQRENPAKYAASKVEFDRIMNRMRMTQLPEVQPYLMEFY